MKIKLLSAFLLFGLALFAQQNETKKIVKIQGNDTTIIMINSQIDQMDSMLTEEMKKIYIQDSTFGLRKVEVFMDTIMMQSQVNTTKVVNAIRIQS